MKVNYFGYHLLNKIDGSKVLFDLRDFLKAYSKLDSPTFKNNFTHQDENIYLLHHIDDIYLFIITRSQELIRKINTSDMSVGEIKQLLDTDERIGFASYLIFQDNYFGFGCTLLAPKFDVFSSHINNVFESLGITEWLFVPQPFLHQATKEEILKSNFIGNTRIELSKENSFTRDLLNLAKADYSDTLDIEGIEIILKPKNRKSIKPTVDKFIKEIPDEGIEKMIIKTKSEGASLMTDLYLAGKGSISDSINRNVEHKIAERMKNKIENNKLLLEKVMEYRSNEKFEKKSIDIISKYNNDTTWTDLIRNLYKTSRIK